MVTSKLREIAAAAGIIFTRAPQASDGDKICWRCYTKWVCSGKPNGKKPVGLSVQNYSCPVCESRDLRNASDIGSEDCKNS